MLAGQSWGGVLGWRRESSWRLGADTPQLPIVSLNEERRGKLIREREVALAR